MQRSEINIVKVPNRIQTRALTFGHRGLQGWMPSVAKETKLDS